ncbi:MAG: DUF1207 domain-containing protein [Chlamydiota bacterium]
MKRCAFIISALLCIAQAGAVEKTSDAFLQGSILEFIKVEYCKNVIGVSVKDGCVYLCNAPSSYMLRKEMVEYIESFCGVKKVIITSIQDCADKPYFSYEQGRLLPDYPILWEPWIANPREVMCSIAYRQGDRVIGKTASSVSFGSEFPIYRWQGLNFFSYKGDLELSLEGCLYAVFNMNPTTPKNVTFTHELVNADYYIGIPVTYAHDRMTYRFRLYHISSHLGDQFLVDHPGFVRYNMEYEAIDLKASYQLTKTVEIYGGIGDYIISDTSFPMKSLYFDYGFQMFIPWVHDRSNDLLWEPFLALFLQNQQYEGWILNQNISVGIRSRHLDGNSTKMAFSLEYYNGRSQEGTFSLYRTTYGQVKFSYAF